MDQSSHTTRILAVDDDQNNLTLIRHQLESVDYHVYTAANGEAGLALLEAHKESIHVILLDRKMPKMDGMEFLREIKSCSDFSDIPVIMQTGVIDESSIAEGIAAGAYYYLTKPYNRSTLLAITHAAASSFVETKNLRKDLKNYTTRLHLTKEIFFEASTMEDVHYLATSLANYYPDPERVVNGISELLLNAVEHGNLGVTYWMKSQLMADATWPEEINRRLSMPEHSDKRVQVHFQRHPTKITLTIKDEGEGFNWEKYMELESGRATHSHGRGIALARLMSFDDIAYLGNGNELICTVNL